MTDDQFFALYPDRMARIRRPTVQLVKSNQRGVHAQPECEPEFMTLGPHKRERRMIILWRVPRDNTYYDPDRPQILKIPLLQFGDEEIADRDDILLPIVDELMRDAARS